MTFKEKVLSVVSKIPRGKIMTYGEVAKASGSPGAARAVGTIMAQNYLKDVPCHRVVRSDGKAGAYNRGGEIQKIKMLRSEGVSLF